MLARYFEAGGPVMYLILVTWIIVLAGVLDRAIFALGTLWRQPLRHIRRDARSDVATARALLEREQRLAARGLERIDAVSQMATSLGLFGTVLGLASTFFGRGLELSLAAPEVITSGLATALFTTVAGLIVFLFGQVFLIVWTEWQQARERILAGLETHGE